MDERTTKRRGPLLWLKGRSRRFWIAVALPLFYVWSYGLALWLFIHVPMPTWIVYVYDIYAPIDWARNHSSTFKIIVDGYVSLFLFNRPADTREWLAGSIATSVAISDIPPRSAQAGVSARFDRIGH